MKKIFSMTMAAILALTVAAFGFSACDELDSVIDSVTSSDSTGGTSTGTSGGGTSGGGTSSGDSTDSGTSEDGGTSGGDEQTTTVTAAEWMAIMSVANSLLNVTVDVDYTSQTTTTFDDGDVGVDYETQKSVIKTDLASDLTGTIYLYQNSEYSDLWNGEAGASYSMISTQYEVFAADSYSYVYSSEYIQADDDPYTWYDGYMTSETYSLTDSDTYSILSYVDTLANLYLLFTYADGVYTYSSDAMTVSVTFSGLYISAIQLEILSTHTSEGYYTDNTTETYSLTFSDYGATEIEIPEEYTYEYYAASNVSVTEEEWAAVFSIDKMYNVTAEYESVRYTENADGSTETATETTEVKSALILQNDQLTGNIYYCNSAEYANTEANGEEWTYGGITTDYSVYAESFYTYVNSYLSIDSEEEAAPYWDGGLYEEAQTFDYSYGGSFLNNIINNYADYYEQFTYENGVYTAVIDGGSISITIDNGYLAQIIISTTYVYEGEFTETTVETYTFTNYGTTTVEVPEGYTYDYYLANYAAAE